MRGAVEAACRRCAEEGHFALDPEARAGAAPPADAAACWHVLHIEDAAVLRPRKARSSIGGRNRGAGGGGSDGGGAGGLRDQQDGGGPALRIRAVFSECTDMDRIAHALAAMAIDGGGGVGGRGSSRGGGPRRAGAGAAGAAGASRATPDGLLFESELDELREDAAAARAVAALQPLAEARRAERRAELWEALPLLGHAGGPAERPWATAGSREEDFAGETYYGMAPLVAALADDPAAAALRPRSQQCNRGLLLEAADAADARASASAGGASAPTAAAARGGAPSTRAGDGERGLWLLRQEPAGRWEWLCGVAMLRPAYVRAQLAERARRPAQDRVLEGIAAVQRRAAYEDGLRAVRARLAGAAAQRAEAEAELAAADAELLARGWDPGAFDRRRRAAAALAALGRSQARWEREKARAKTAHALLTARSADLRWLQPAWRDAVYGVLSCQPVGGAGADDSEDDAAAAAGAGASGGPMESGLVRAIAACDDDDAADRNAAAAMGPDEVVEWAGGLVALRGCPGRRSEILALLAKRRIGGRTLVRLRRAELLDMGLTSPAAALLLASARGLQPACEGGGAAATGRSAKARGCEGRLEGLSVRFAALEAEEAQARFLEAEVRRPKLRVSGSVAACLAICLSVFFDSCQRAGELQV